MPEHQKLEKMDHFVEKLKKVVRILLYVPVRISYLYPPLYSKKLVAVLWRHERFQ